MIYDKEGNEVREPEPKHKFGQFRIPDDARVTFRGVYGQDNHNSGTVIVAHKQEKAWQQTN